MSAMVMLIDTPDPRYRPDSGRDGPGPPRPGRWTALLLAAAAVGVYLARRDVAAIVELALLLASFAAFLAALFSLWLHGDDRREEDLE